MRVARVASEALVAAVARQRDRDVPAGEPADQISRNLGLVGERLVVNLRQRRDDREGLVRRHLELGVVGPQVPGDVAGVGRLVVLGEREADRERPHRTVGLRLHQGHDGELSIPPERNAPSGTSASMR